MDDVKVCRICLEMDVTLHSLHSNSLERYYEIITGTNPLVKSLLPMYACYECAAMLKKFFMFRQKSLRGQVILQGILQICGKINEVDIKEIDRRSFHLNSSLTTVNLPYIDAEPEINDDLIKQEPREADNIEDIVRKAFDNDCLSDDETLSMLKSLNYEKIKEEEAIPALEEIKEEKSEEPCDTDSVEDIVSERLDNDCLSNDEPLSIHKIRKYEKSMEEEVAILMLEKEPGKADNVEDIVSKCLDNDRLSDDAPLSTHKRRKYEKSKEEEVAILTLEKEPREADNNEDIVSEYLDSDRLSDDAPLSMHKRRKYEKSKGEEVAIPALEKSKDKADNIERLDNDKLSYDAPLSMHKRRKYEKSKEEEVAILAKKSKNPEEVEVRGTLKSVMNFPYGCIDTLNFKSFVTIITLTEDEQREEIRKRQESENYKNSNLKCELCFKGFLDMQTWQHHAKKHDETSGSVECEICKLRFKTRRILNKHVVGHAKKYLCKYCPYVSRHVSQAKQHLFWHQGVTYKCPYCDEMLSKWTSYLSHVRLKHPSDFICGFCGYSFVSKLGLSMHKTMMHKDLPTGAGRCARAVLRAVRRALRVGRGAQAASSDRAPPHTYRGEQERMSRVRPIIPHRGGTARAQAHARRARPQAGALEQEEHRQPHVARHLPALFRRDCERSSVLGALQAIPPRQRLSHY